MAPHGSNPLFSHFTQDIPTDPETRAQERSKSTTNKSPGVFGWLSHEVFRRDCLDRRLERHHITGQSSYLVLGLKRNPDSVKDEAE